MSGESVFPVRVLALLAATMAIIFTASLLLTLHGDDRNGDPNTIEMAGSNSFSRSAVGHLGVFEWLRRLGISAVRSQYESATKLDANGMLILAEPNAEDPRRVLKAPMQLPHTILLVLPKFAPHTDMSRKDWIAGAELLPESKVQSVYLAYADAAKMLIAAQGKQTPPQLHPAEDGIEGEVIRSEGATMLFAEKPFAAPTGRRGLQLLRNSKLIPLVACSEGILLGQIAAKDLRLLILSDPEILENHGFADPANAAFLHTLFENGRGKGGVVLFDETIHGFYRAPPNLLDALRRFPNSLIFVQFVLALLLLLWSANQRFGAVRPIAPPHQDGKTELIVNTAALLDMGGHQALILHRYLTLSTQEVARKLRAPAGLSADSLTQWLDKAGRRIGQKRLYSDILKIADQLGERDSARLLDAARSVYHWRKELVDGFD